MRTARIQGQRRTISLVSVLRSVPVALPRNHIQLFVDVRLAFSRGVAGDHIQILGKWDLGAVDVFIVRLKGGGVDFRVVVPINVVQGGRPVNGEVVRVFA